MQSPVARVGSLDRKFNAGEKDSDEIYDFIPDASVDVEESSTANVVNEEIKRKVDSVLSTLSPRDKKIMMLRFGLDEDGRERSLEEVGQAVGLTRSGVRLREDKSLGLLSQNGNLRELWEHDTPSYVHRTSTENAFRLGAMDAEISVEFEAQVKELREQGLTGREIAERLDVHPSRVGMSINNLLQAEKKEHRIDDIRELVARVKKLRLQGLTNREVAEAVGQADNVHRIELIASKLIKTGEIQPMKSGQRSGGVAIKDDDLH